MRSNPKPAPRVLPVLAVALALAAAFASDPDARPTPTSLREGIDPRTGQKITRPRPSLPPPAWSSAVSPDGVRPDFEVAPEWPDEGSYPERVLEELALHAQSQVGALVLPTTQSYDRGNIAVIEDDGTILIPSGANVRLDGPALTRKFLAIHNDEYDDLCVFAASVITNLTLGGGFAYELNVRNEVAGLGLSQFDYSAQFGSAGVLHSFQNFNRLSKWPADPNQSGVVATNSSLDVIAHETGHRYGAYTLFQDGDTASTALLGRDDQHWGFFFNSLASEMEGNQWRDNGGGSFTTVDATSRFSFLDEYLFGLRDSSEVDTLWYVANPSSFNPPNAYVRRSPPEIGVSAMGVKRFVDISQITAVNGLRAPGSATSPRVRRMAWVLLVRNGEVPSAADLAKLDLFRSSFEPHYAAAVHGLASVDTHLNSVAGSVSITHVPIKDSEDTASPRSIPATMKIAQKSIRIGFDAGSPRLHYRTNSGPWQLVVMAPQGGDDYAGSIPPQPNNTLVDYWFSASSDSAGIAGTLPADAPASWFRYRVGVDVTPPTLAHTPPPDPAASQMPLAVRVQAFDNLALDSVGVEWQKTGGPLQSTMAAASGDGPYTFSIGAGAVYGDVVTYRFTAVDRATVKNRARVPATAAPYSLLIGSNYAETFEASEGGYTHSAVSPTFADAWHLESGSNHTAGGTWAWKCGSVGAGTYRANLDAGLVSAPMAIGPGGHLKFWHDFDAETGDTPAEAYDGGLVELSVDNGANWSRITPLGGYPSLLLAGSGNPLPGGTPVYSGTSNGFVLADFDLSAWAGQTARLRWRFTSDGFIEKAGWYVDDVTMTSAGGQPVGVPIDPGATFTLGAAVPNPSAGRASISYRLPVAQEAKLALYDVRGRLVRVLFDGVKPAGAHAVEWDGRMDDGRGAPAGLYFYRMTGKVSGTREGRLVRLP